ncbi:HAD-IC family P-type ATPase [Halomonas sp. E19]
MPDRQDAPRTAWHAMSLDEAMAKVESSRDGLSDDDASSRREQHGPNRLKQEKGRPWWRRLLEQFNNVLMIILLVAAVASLFLGHTLDALAIVAVVIIIALIGFFQEGKAEQALESIRNMLSPQASVLRDGKRQTISAEDLVPGDIVMLESGDRVPADLRLLEAKRLRTEEAALTGESTPVDKQTDPVDEDADLGDRSAMVYASTIVVQGTAQG